MARRAKPWYRKAENAWYVTLNGRQTFIGKHPEESPRPRRGKQGWNVPESITDLFDKIKRDEPVIRHDSVVAIVDAFLDWVKNHRAEKTYDWYLSFLEPFCRTVISLQVDQLKPFHVNEWLDDSWGDTTKRAAITCVKRCFNWAVKQGYCEKSPVAHLEKPEAKQRTEIITPAEYEKILRHATDDFRDLLIFAWETGARPQECFAAESRHFDKKNSRLVFPKEEAKGKRKPRIIYLNDAALAVVKGKEGRIFLNQDGEPFSKDSTNCRFRRMKKHVGNKYCLYMFRHSYATRMLEAGVDPLTLAVLLGHSNPAMLATTYQHLSLNPEHLLEQAKRA